MVSASQQLNFAVRAINEAQNTLKDVQGDIKGISDQADKGSGPLSKFGGFLGNVAATAGGFVVANGLMQLPGFLTGAAQAAAEDEAATLRLEQAMRNVGGSFDDNMAKINNRIAVGQKLAFSDDDIRDSFQKLVASTGDVDEALSRQTLAMDLARGAGIPLAQASTLLGKVTAENVEVFKRMGITIGEGASEADAMAAIQAKFGGQADAYAQSTAGQFEVAKIKMAEAKETMGSALLPVMGALAEVLSVSLGPALSAFEASLAGAQTAAQFISDNFETLLPLFIAVAAALGTGLVIALTTIIPLIWAKAAAWAAAAAAALAANAPMLLLVGTVALVAAGVVLLIQHWDDITEKFPILGRAADEVKAAFQAFAEWITGSFIPAVQSIYDKMSEVVTAVIGFVSDHWDEIRAIIQPAVEAWMLIISTAWDQIRLVFETVWGVIKGFIDVAMGIFTGDWDRVWQGVKGIIDSVWGGIKGTIENTIELIKGLGPKILEAGTALGTALFDGLKSALSSTAGFAGDVGSAVLDAVKRVVNEFVIDPINSALSFKISVPLGPDINVNPPDIPRLAMGGIVRRPTLALIGEAGPEAVVPLNRGGRSVGNTYNVTLNIAGDADEAKIKSALDRWLTHQLGPGAVQWGVT